MPAEPARRRAPEPALPALTDAQIVILLTRASLDSYAGSCPCPDNTMRNGRRCGGNSPWSRPGGRKPLCYPDDVTPEMISAYRARPAIAALSAR